MSYYLKHEISWLSRNIGKREPHHIPFIHRSISVILIDLGVIEVVDPILVSDLREVIA